MAVCLLREVGGSGETWGPNDIGPRELPVSSPLDGSREWCASVTNPSTQLLET